MRLNPRLRGHWRLNSELRCLAQSTQEHVASKATTIFKLYVISFIFIHIIYTFKSFKFRFERLLIMGVDHGEGTGGQVPRIWSGELSPPPRFCHVAKF